ncbi:methionine--tRNA ligase [Candidatus Uhrbacteria bacterium]|nr:methionine--tRNA ligase [Candidatus Uhrbacteria bacterium]
MKKFYLTTPIYYVNAMPHVGHAYTTTVADVLARYHRLKGETVFFLTGTDENSQNNLKAAEKHGYKDLNLYLDDMAAKWRQTFGDLDITFDRFIRTTEADHKKGVEKFWRRVAATGDIYAGEYEGWYCDGCEGFKTEADLVEGKCPLHKTAPRRLKEKNYFFKLTKYRQALLDHIDAHPEFIMPEGRRNEVRSYVASFMEDVSISRQTVTVGIPVPDDPSSVIYVWFDALINYLTGIGYGTDDAKFAEFWPADLHLVGKDIIKFHCALWPAMLMSAGLPLPTQVFAHGFLLTGGDKMSKSLGNVVDPAELAKKYGNDPLRYFMLREVPFGSDGDFSVERIEERYGGDLANEFGNLLHRVLAMTEKYFDGKVPAAVDGQVPEWAAYEKGMATLDFAMVLDAVWTILREANKLIDTEKPWELAKTDRARLAGLLYSLLERLRQVGWMLLPILPTSAKKLFVQLGLPDEDKRPYDQAKVWGGLKEGGILKKGEPLFPRLTP